MEMRKTLNKIRGWLPKEPSLQNCETPVKNNFKLFAHRMAIALVVGTITAALLGVVGSLLGLTEGIGVYVWTLTTVMLINTSIGVYAKYMLRKLGLPPRTKPW